MKRILTIFLIPLVGLLPAQNTTIVLQPDPDCGKDVYLYSIAPDHNLGNFPDFIACAWTHSGVPVTVRSLIEFDISAIPPGTTIVQATLDLYHYNSTQNAGHSSLSGSNAAHLYRVTQSWDEHTATWNSQPSYTTLNAVALPASLTNTQNYSVDITTLVQNCIDDPLNSFGFMFKEDLESYYRSMLFASSDNANPAIRPKLTLVLSGTGWQTGACAVAGPPDTTITNPPDTTVSNPVDTTQHNTQVATGVQEELIIPNIFSPNGDGKNDMYFITCSPVVSYHMNIYDRWGLKLAEIDKAHPVWNGTSDNGTLCQEGVYYYTLDLQSFTREAEHKTGFIQLMNEEP
jgi:gliding motility-associated-like protein